MHEIEWLTGAGIREAGTCPADGHIPNDVSVRNYSLDGVSKKIWH